MDALKNEDKCLIARDNIFHCLSRALFAHTSSDIRGNTPREGHRFL